MCPEALTKHVHPPWETRQIHLSAGLRWVNSSSFQGKFSHNFPHEDEKFTSFHLNISDICRGFFTKLHWLFDKKLLPPHKHDPSSSPRPFPCTNAPQIFLPRHCWRCSWRCFPDNPWNGNAKKIRNQYVNKNYWFLPPVDTVQVRYNSDTIWTINTEHLFEYLLHLSHLIGFRQNLFQLQLYSHHVLISRAWQLDGSMGKRCTCRLMCQLDRFGMTVGWPLFPTGSHENNTRKVMNEMSNSTRKCQPSFRPFWLNLRVRGHPKRVFMHCN